MGVLRKRRSSKSKSKKPLSSNPYSGRGLDKFALVSAELAAKREELSAKMGTPLSVVRFAIGSHSKWVPIIISSSHSSTRALQAIAAAKADHKHGDPTAVMAATVAAATGRRQQQASLPCPAWERDEIQQDPISHGMPYSIKKDDKDTFIQHDDVEEITSSGNGIDNMESLSGDIQAAKFVSLKMSLETALANLLVILKAHRGPSVDKVEDIDGSTEEPIKDDGALSSHNLQDVHSLPPLTSSKVAALTSSEESLALPAVPPVRITSTAKLRNESTATKAKALDTSSIDAAMSNPDPTKHRSRFKGCPRRKECSSAPSTPRDSRQPKPKTTVAGQSHATAVAIETKSSFKFPSWKPHNDHLNAKGDQTPRRRSHLKDQIDRVDNKEAKIPLNDLLKGLGALMDASDTRTLAKKDSLKRNGKLASNKGIGSATIEQKRAERLGQALTLVGPVLVLGGLVTGYMAAIAAVVCWWYALPKLRRAVGDKPFVRSHHHLHTHVGTGTATASNVAMKTSTIASDVNHPKKKKKVLTEVGSGKYDLQSSQYKKKVIMDGLLDRGLHTKT